MNITTPSVASQRSFSKELTKLRTNQQILTILVLLFICMVFWIIVSLFSSQTSTKVTPEMTQKAEPLNPTLSTQVLDTLESKKVFTDEELSNFPIYVIQKSTTDQIERIVELKSGQAAPTTSNTPQPTATPQPATTTTPQTGNQTDTVEP